MNEFKIPRLTRWQFFKNKLAYRMLKLMGFTVYTNRYAGMCQDSGKIIWLTACAGKLGYETPSYVEEGS